MNEFLDVPSSNTIKSFSCPTYKIHNINEHDVSALIHNRSVTEDGSQVSMQLLQIQVRKCTRVHDRKTVLTIYNLRPTESFKIGVPG